MKKYPVFYFLCQAQNIQPVRLFHYFVFVNSLFRAMAFDVFGGDLFF